MTDTNSYESRVAQLCQNCRHLLIHDKALGGYKSDSGPGTASFLKFDSANAYQRFKTGYLLNDSYPELSLLAESVRAGCKCCAFIRETISTAELDPPETTTMVTLQFSYQWKHKGGFGSILVTVVFTSEEPGTNEEPPCFYTIVFDIDSIFEPCISWLRLERSPEPDILSPRNIEWMTKLLRSQEYETASEYEDMHPGAVEQEQEFLPTRLIDLGSKEYSQYPRLFTTTRSNLEERMTRINLDHTTAVLKDAAEVCMALGIRYLWVDSDHECSQMTLASKEFWRDPTVCLTSHSSPTSNQTFPVTTHCDIFTKDTEESTLFTRAWTYQEYHFSRVALLFGRRKIHAVNHQCCISENEKEEVPTNRLCFPRHDLSSIHKEWKPPFDFYTQWMKFIVFYSKRQFTYSADKLPAISGLAAEFQAYLNDRYVAGLWEKDLYRQLFWHPYLPSLPLFSELLDSWHSRQPYVAPSWSWACQTHRINWDCYRFTATASPIVL
ncbi:hypothetical protein HD806DRAFT_518352 [Xylariaceae sp. AK1471]|nr:hypothetical protein HD806DRAFT_518352 [Xylariaceae sp. AK1471]